MSELHITRGLPASGKSTFARAWVAEDTTSRVRINRDDTRAMIHPTYSGRDTEEATTTACHAAIRACLRNNRDVIVDDTNLNGGIAKSLAKLAAQCGATFTVHDFPVDVDEAVARDAARDRTVGEKVIRGMHDRYLAHLKGEFLPPVATPAAAPIFKPYDAVPGTPRAVIVDIDGTLARNDGHRSFYDYTQVAGDSLIGPVAVLLHILISQGYTPIVMSGRDDSCREATEDWLSNNADLHEGDYIGPLMRQTGDKRDDAIVKMELFDAHVRDHFDVRYVLDDRNRVVRAWRSIGLTCLQVADGDF